MSSNPNPNLNPNPYAPPAAISRDLPPPTSFPPPPSRAAAVPFQSPTLRATVTMALLAVALLINLASILLRFTTIALLMRMADGYQPTQEGLDMDTMLVTFPPMIYIVFRLGAGIAFLFWTYRVAENLRSLGVERQEYTPGWACGWYFVPILNLFRPIQALSEIWKGSDPARLTGDKHAIQSEWILGLWWTLHIISLISDRVATVMGAQKDPTIEFLIALNITIVGMIPRDLVQMLMIRNLSHNQHSRIELVQSGVVPAELKPGPPPMTFPPPQ
jgi:hypothetical protein